MSHFCFVLSLLFPSAFQCTRFCLRCTLIGMYTLLLEFFLFMFWRESTLRGNFLLTQSLVWDAKIFHITWKCWEKCFKDLNIFKMCCSEMCNVQRIVFVSTEISSNVFCFVINCEMMHIPMFWEMYLIWKGITTVYQSLRRIHFLCFPCSMNWWKGNNHLMDMPSIWSIFQK